MAEDLIGQEFENVSDVKTFIAEYNETHFTNFVFTSSNSRQINIRCKHGYDRKSRCTGKRPKQHLNFMDCQGYIRLYKGKSEKYKITSNNLTHNHPTTATIHQFNNAVLNEEDRDLLLTLKEANAKPSQIKRVLIPCSWSAQRWKRSLLTWTRFPYNWIQHSI